MASRLEVKALKAEFGGFLLGPLDLELEPGSSLALLGPSGCGKTSLLKCLAGIAPVLSGSISLDGRELSGTPPERRGMGLVSQGGDLFPHLSVRGNMEFGMRSKRLPRREISRRLDELLALFKLEALADRSPSGLSGGEGKRVALARALAPEPRLLLLDEPLGMLDHNGRLEMAEALKLAQSRFGATMLHVTHDRLEAWTVASHCAVMNGGAILQKGRIEDLFRRPETKFVAEFLGAENVVKAVFEGHSARLGEVSLPLESDCGSKKGWLSIRADEIRAVRGPDGGPPLLSGTLVSLQDLGSHVKAAFRCPDASCEIVSLMRLGESLGLEIGSSYGLAWPLDAAHPILKE